MNLPSNCHCTADILFKLPALYQLFRPDEQNERAVGAAEHTVDLVDADVAVFCRFSGGQRHFEGFEKKFCQLVKDASVVAMSGSVPKGLDGSAYQRLVKIVKDAGKPVILDTSGKLLEEGIKAAPTLIKPNIDEIRMLTGKHCDDINDIIEAAKAIHAGGVEIVAVSLGADGSLAVGKEGIFRAVVPKIDAVNTVGCGDSMIAGFALGLSEGLSLEETLRRASAISAAAAMREETGFFVMEDMEALLPKIEIRRL